MQNIALFPKLTISYLHDQVSNKMLLSSVGRIMLFTVREEGYNLTGQGSPGGKRIELMVIGFVVRKQKGSALKPQGPLLVSSSLSKILPPEDSTTF